MDTQGQIRIGTSGFHYNHWKGLFYPDRLPKTKWLDFYASRFDTVEINNTFYRLPEIKTFVEWRDRVPENFCYALKFSRFGSHMKRLSDPHETVRSFLERAEQLGSRMGPILVQLGPRHSVDAQRLGDFLGAASSEYRWVIEFRHPSWLTEEIYALLRRHNAALCIHDLIADHPRVITADWTYLRYHGGGTMGDYSLEFLQEAARRIHELSGQGLDVYTYFNNDLYGYAVKNARDLKTYVLETQEERP